MSLRGRPSSTCGNPGDIAAELDCPAHVVDRAGLSPGMKAFEAMWARIGLGAVGPTPILATEAAKTLIGKPVSDASYKAAGEAARETG